MLRVFVCSPFSGSASEREQNVKTAVAVCQALCAAGAAPFAPHLHYPAFLNDDDSDDRALAFRCGMAWLDAADAMVVFTGLGITSGMEAEISHAIRVGKPIAFLERLGSALRFKRFSGKELLDLEEAWARRK